MNLRKGLTIFSVILVCVLFVSGVFLTARYNAAAFDVTPAEDPYPTSSGTVIQDSSSVNILIVCEENHVADDIYILNYSPETNVSNFLTLPGNTQTLEKGKINSIVSSDGMIGLIDYIKANLGINIRYYFKFDYTAFKDIVDILDGVSFNVPVDFKSETTNLNAGTQMFSGDMAVSLFRFKDPYDGHYTKELLEYYDGTQYERTLLHADFIVSLLSQKGNATYIPRLTDVLSQCGTRIETNITADEWTGLIAKADTISTKKITQYILAGTEETDGNQFFVSNGRIKEMEVDREYALSEVVNSIFWSTSLS